MLQKENEEAKHAFELQLVKQRETFELEVWSLDLTFLLLVIFLTFRLTLRKIPFQYLTIIPSDEKC